MTFATTLSRVAALCLLAGAAHALPVPVADSGAPVPATVYAPAAGYRPAPPEAAGPALVWREQNRIVAAGDAMPATHDHAAMHGAVHAKTAGAPATIAAAMSMQTASAEQCGGAGASCCKGATMACCAKGDGAAMPSCAPATAAKAGAETAPAHAGHQHGGHH